MHITLSRRFAELDDLETRSHAVVIERILMSHSQSHHLFCLSPAQVNKIRGAINLGILPTTTLDLIERRSQDYMQSARSAARIVEMTTLLDVENLEIDDRIVRIGPRTLLTWLEHRPKLFVENALNDGRCVTFFGEQICEREGLSKLIAVSPFHGGGGTLGALVDSLEVEEIKGLILCDRDRSHPAPPP